MQPVLCLQKPVTFRRPRSWELHIRYAQLTGGQERIVEPGAWLLEMGEAQVWTSGDNLETEYIYRLATGELVALDRPLTEAEATEVSDPQGVAAMNAFRSTEEAIYEDLGVTLLRQCRHLPPFALVKCPLCGSTEFTSVDLASAWCDRCNARFTVRSTAGDPGFVVDCTWEHYNPAAARYVIPRTDTLYLCLVLKDSGDPRDMQHDPQGWCFSAARDEECRPDAPKLTGDDIELRSGLHECPIGTLYDWDIHGRVPTPEDLGERVTSGWEIEGQWWPRCATVRVLCLDQEELATLRSAAAGLRPTWENIADSLEEMAQSRAEPPAVCQIILPPVSELQDGEYYLLHHWLTVVKETIPPMRSEYAWPIWYTVKPLANEYDQIERWEVVRRDICPRCGKRVRPEDLDAAGEWWTIPHGYCRETWTEMGWQLPSPAEEEAKS